MFIISYHLSLICIPYIIKMKEKNNIKLRIIKKIYKKYILGKYAYYAIKCN